ncbi:MAG: Hsp20/alpha crystallin family protein [Bryobacteraceae bacterium]
MLVRYNPWADFGSLSNPLKAFDNALQSFFPETHAPAVSPWTPPVDIVETENELVVKADAPGVKPEDIEVKFEDGTLILKGKREFEKKEDGKGYHRIERSYGTFMRAFTLPETVDPEKLTADYSNGTLTVSIGKKEVAKPKSVKVNVKAS